jgi:hypothetical protein
MGNASEDYVVEPLELLMGSPTENWVSVTVETTPPRRDSIEDPSSILKGQEAPPR